MATLRFVVLSLTLVAFVEGRTAMGQAVKAGAGKDKAAYAWRSDKYVPPGFEDYFPNDLQGGLRLDELFQAADRDAREDAEILAAVRQGLRQTHQHRTLILRWIGNRYIWNRSPQNPDAIELMYHAADFSGPRADPYGTRHYAVYFGLSVVNEKTPNILRTLVDLALKVDDPNDLSRIAWGAASQRDELLALLRPHLDSTDETVRAKAQVLQKIFTGELPAFQWSRQQTRARAQAKYAAQLPQIKTDLLEGDSAKRQQLLRQIQQEGIVLIMDDSFLPAMAACAADPSTEVRRQVAVVAGDHWVWQAKDQNRAAIQIMLRLARDEDREVRSDAVYYGLSTVRDKDKPLVRTLVDLALADREPNWFRRIAWGLQTNRPQAAEVLQEYLDGDDAAKARQAREVYKDLIGADPPTAR